jgi:hypothetical protein
MKKRTGKPIFICEVCGNHSTSKSIIAKCEACHAKQAKDTDLWSKQPLISVPWDTTETCKMTFAEAVAILIFPGHEMFVDSKENKAFNKEFRSMVPACGKRPDQVLNILVDSNILRHIPGWTTTWEGEPEDTWDGVRVPTESDTIPARYKTTPKGNSVRRVLEQSSNPAQISISARKAAKLLTTLKCRKAKAARALEAAEAALRDAKSKANSIQGR